MSKGTKQIRMGRVIILAQWVQTMKESAEKDAEMFKNKDKVMSEISSVRADTYQRVLDKIIDEFGL